MTFQSKITELSERYLADARAPDIPGFVDQLFRVAAETGAVACNSEGETRLRFFVPRNGCGHAARLTQSQTSCIVENAAGSTVLRMICARLGVICKEQTETDISLYGDKAKIEYEIQDHRCWNVAFANTTDCPEFLIECRPLLP